jgi:hypothetical protein
VRFQQIAKELHIELVVLHDQDGFCHPVPPIPELQVRNMAQQAPPPDVSKSEFKLAPDSL